MNKILPYYSLLSIVFLIGCLQAFFVGIPKTMKHHPIVSHLLEKPEDSALLLVKNGKIVIDRNSETQLPLASLSKIVIGLVFAEQVAEDIIEPEQKINLERLERFYVDDENYQTWRKTGLAEGWIKEEQVALKYVAQGAVRFSANTNADFLMEHLGLSSINNWLQEKGLATHEAIFPFTASAIVCHNLEKTPKKIFLDQMDTISTAAYTQKVLSVQEKLASGTDPFAKSLTQQKINDQKAIKIWSDHFMRATALDYGKLTQLLLDKKAMSKALQQQISFLFEEWAFAENPGLDQQFSSIGYKGGSTGYLLNTILYMEDLDGNQVQVVLLMNELSPKKHRMIGKLFSGFVFDLATNDVFARNIQQVLAKSD